MNIKINISYNCKFTKKGIVCFFFFWSYLNLNAQIRIGNNLIADSSFENNNTLFNANYSYRDSFNTRSKTWINPTDGTSDFYSSQYKIPGGLSSPIFIKYYRDTLDKYYADSTYFVSPKTGETFTGIGFAMTPKKYKFMKGNDYREFIQTKLTGSLKPNTSYQFTFSYIKILNSSYCDSTFPLDVFFSNQKIENKERDCINNNNTWCTKFKVDYVPQIQFFNIPFNYSKTPFWETLSGIFKSGNFPLNYMTIGHFSDSTYMSQFFTKNYIQEIYYFLDDISLYEIPGIIAPDTVCLHSTTALTTTLGMPYYWSSKADGSDTLSTDSVYYYKADATKMLYAFGRYSTDSVLITTVQIPKLNWPDTMHFCEGDSIVLNAGSKPYTFRWNTGSYQPSQTIKQTGLYKVTISNYTGCRDSFNTFVQKESNPELNSDSVFTLCESIGESITLNAGAHYYCKWTPSNIEQCSINLSKAGNFMLEAKSEYNCRSIQNFYISDYCKPRIFIPNAIHTQGINNVFAPKIMYARNVQLTIFNRWGEILHEQSGAEVEWNGRYMNTDCMPGLYFYIIRISPVEGGDDIVIRGCLQLL